LEHKKQIKEKLLKRRMESRRVHEMFAEMDGDGSGDIDYDEFRAALPTVSDQTLHELFTLYDKDGDGSLTMVEVAPLFRALHRAEEMAAGDPNAQADFESTAAAVLAKRKAQLEEHKAVADSLRAREWWLHKGIVIGVFVRHATRGIGRITVIEPICEQGDARVHVTFAQSEVHRYGKSSWHMLATHADQLEAQAEWSASQEEGWVPVPEPAPGPAPAIKSATRVSAAVEALPRARHALLLAALLGERDAMAAVHAPEIGTLRRAKDDGRAALALAAAASAVAPVPTPPPPMSDARGPLSNAAPAAVRAAPAAAPKASTATAVAAARGEGGGGLGRRNAQVSVLLCTVTFYANLAHSLTCSP
jgi:Ca2+-binding EF-hand superfamily protein